MQKLVSQVYGNKLLLPQRVITLLESNELMSKEGHAGFCEANPAVVSRRI